MRRGVNWKDAARQAESRFVHREGKAAPTVTAGDICGKELAWTQKALNFV
jgi:hypothetical protein